MSLPAKLFADQRRAERKALDADATLRDTSRLPHDVRVDEISATGCHVVTLLDLPAGAAVTIGIPRIGMREATIARETDGGYGCIFKRPLAPSELAAALTAQNSAPVAIRNFPHLQSGAAAPRLTPPGLIGAMIIGSIAASWMAVGLILGLLGAS